ncbi:uncharacterized protein LOC120090794 [Benincasa hispida]|uniref:uncharacterized protein LOC120090794 n=1 Tax=Benincasa hispida TaxID=102211 RepID=UPI001902120D|nr:uncharacterized protein LOC120090794 [Benincasa hispida]
MPNYVKFLKDILANKRKIGENEIVSLTYECSALFQNNIPKKRKDLGSFTLSCSIGGKEVGNALCDLGANYEADTEVQIILGRPFLATGRALIYAQKGKLNIRVDNQQAKFNVLIALKYLNDIENCHHIGELQEGQWHKLQEETEEEDFEIGAMMEQSCTTIQTDHDFESMNLFERLTKRIKPSLEEPLVLEMKALPMHLKYVYLRGNDTLLVIISASLSKENEKALIQVLKKYVKALR